MKLTKKQEAEIFKVHEAYWHNYIHGDVDSMILLLDDNYTQVGSAESEVFFNKKDAVKFLYDTIDQIAGKVEMRNRNTRLEIQDNIILILEHCDLYALAEDSWIFYTKFRATTLIHHKNEEWKIIHQHSSFPNTKAEDGQNIAIDIIATENHQLKETVKRHTVELEYKNRELEIEAALDRVRSKTMAMQHSYQLREVAATTLEQLQSLGFTYGACSIVIMDALTGDMIWWISGFEKEYPASYHIPYFEHPFYLAQLNNWKEGKKYAVMECFGEAKKSYDKIIFSKTEFVKIPVELQKIMQSFEKITFSNAYMQHGALSWSTEPLQDEYAKILQRFAGVFEQSYTRFLDLQKAEAQAKEAQIELSLERVRSRSISMTKTDELSQVTYVLFTELRQLDLVFDRSVIITVDKDLKGIVYWLAGSEGLLSQNGFHIPMFEHTLNQALIDNFKNKNEKWVFRLEGENKKKWDDIAFAESDLKYLPDFIKDSMIHYGDVCFSMSSAGFGSLMISGREPVDEAQFEIILRFSKVFDQTYTRFLDLQKAEAQAREAQIETALEKVRSRTMAMQNSNELHETAAVLFQEFKKLGADDVYQVTIGIYDEVKQLMDFRVTSLANNGEQESSSFNLDMNEPTLLQPAVTAWKAGKKSAVFDLTGEVLQSWLTYRNKISGITINVGDTAGRQIITVAYFSKGHLSISTPLPLPQETIKTLERFATVFDGTYTRFLDLEKAEVQAEIARLNLIQIQEAKQKAEEALTELQATQKQLIQSEKMASLGELTAGIAHEIQNPLNFVNNFSEVSTELIDEMNVEIDKGNIEEAKEIASDLKQNLEKINHHGKRADAIVKGMLQHSRSTNNATKEPTNINALADEYLRLAYHGLRAKDKSFNATMKTDFDESINSINIIPQDIGRVILNLLTNAFYATQQKKEANPEGYEPTVSVSTKRNVNNVEIKITDNGNGIPQKVIDKIFQPFFTTKPTGQGTGLGLSLSYDIIKAHGGEISLESHEGKGTTFTIKLPF